MNNNHIYHFFKKKTLIIWRKILILYGGKKTFHGFNLKLNIL